MARSKSWARASSSAAGQLAQPAQPDAFLAGERHAHPRQSAPLPELAPELQRGEAGLGLSCAELQASPGQVGQQHEVGDAAVIERIGTGLQRLARRRRRRRTRRARPHAPPAGTRNAPGARGVARVMCCEPDVRHLERGTEVAALEQQHGADHLAPRHAELAVVALLQGLGARAVVEAGVDVARRLAGEGGDVEHVAAITGSRVRPRSKPGFRLFAQVAGVVVQPFPHDALQRQRAEQLRDGRAIRLRVGGQSLRQRLEVGQLALERSRASAA